MRNLGDLLHDIPLPKATAAEASTSIRREGRGVSTRVRARGEGNDGEGTPWDLTLLHDLGADLPAGHLHLWGGPKGAGKVSVLLSLLCGAAARGRRILYATYDLPASTLARRALAMHAGVSLDAIPEQSDFNSDQVREDQQQDDRGTRSLPVSDSVLRASDPAIQALVRAREQLSALPISLLEARGLSALSLKDRVVRMPFRPEIVAIDHLQGVVRDPSLDVATTVRDLSDMASHLHLSLVCTVKPDRALSERVDFEGASQDPTLQSQRLMEWTQSFATAPDRVAWLAPSTCSTPHQHAGDTAAARDARDAKILRNRHGDVSNYALRVDEGSGTVWRQASDAPRPARDS